MGPVVRSLPNLFSQFAVFASGGSKGGAQGTRAPTSVPKFFYFHAVFAKNWSNNRLAPPLWGWRTPLWEILDPPLFAVFYLCFVEE